VWSCEEVADTKLLVLQSHAPLRIVLALDMLLRLRTVVDWEGLGTMRNRGQFISSLKRFHLGLLCTITALSCVDMTRPAIVPTQATTHFNLDTSISGIYRLCGSPNSPISAGMTKQPWYPDLPTAQDKASCHPHRLAQGRSRPSVSVDEQ
jgi:hypothetical protein